MLMPYLVTSRARRGLLELLWRRNLSGSVSELARLAGVVPSAAEREIEAMKDLGLVVLEWQGNSKVVRADLESPHAGVLRALFEPAPAREIREPSVDQVRTWLAETGAPLLRSSGDGGGRARPDLEEVAVEALRISRLDASVARALPVFFWRNRSRLDLPALVHLAKRTGRGRLLGFFLDLTAELSGEVVLRKAAEELRDGRVQRDIEFFTGAGTSALARGAARQNTPRLARRWHYLMNMPLDSFESLFRKAAGRP